jgi:hypothetical protein
MLFDFVIVIVADAASRRRTSTDKDEQGRTRKKQKKVSQCVRNDFLEIDLNPDARLGAAADDGDLDRFPSLIRFGS